jgi:hypothetical protein
VTIAVPVVDAVARSVEAMVDTTARAVEAVMVEVLPNLEKMFRTRKFQYSCIEESNKVGTPDSICKIKRGPNSLIFFLFFSCFHFSSSFSLLSHPIPPKITLEAAADTAKITTVIGSIQARSYFNCARSPPYSIAPAKRVRIALIRTT